MQLLGSCLPRGVFRTQSNINNEGFFCEISERLKAVIYFHKKKSIVDVRLGPKYTSATNPNLFMK